ncbi:NERD domain-containing protein [Streptomyces sp. 5-10]|nr:NERD domain-containing protein [Streptomyces sp. 5-10]
MEIILAIIAVTLVFCCDRLLKARARRKRKFHPNHAHPINPRRPQKTRDGVHSTKPSGSLIPAKFDLANNEPGEALTKRAMSETGNPLGHTSWHLGADGEAMMADLLDRVSGASFTTLHSVPCPVGGDIDHLVIAKTGIWTINTKHHPKAVVEVMNDGLHAENTEDSDSMIRRAKEEASSAASVLTDGMGQAIFVRPALAYVGGGRVTGTRQACGVVVMRGEDLAHYLSNLPQVLTAQEVAAIYRTARDSRIWWNAKE